MEQVNTVDEYLKKLSRYDIYNNVFYRGQSEEFKSITSSVSRNLGLTTNENSIYKEAMKMRSIEFVDLNYPFEHLSKMQHYGIPTRLVDLTIDPLIALFFAVQNIDNKSHENVYVFIQEALSLNDKKVKLLSLLATLESREIEDVKGSYLECYSESITEDEILEFASEGAFINHSVELQNSNKRLFCQKGTFAICGNEVIGKEIKKSILPLDSIEPTMIIRIPFEHKQAIKKELDTKYNINETTIYPEFLSVADYLKEKYKKVDLNLKDTYNILEVEDISHRGAKRCSIMAVLNKTLRIEEIKHIGIQIIDQYRRTNDVVWIYIAKNGDDYIMRNWLISGQWIRKSLHPKFKPRLIGEVDKTGYIWRFGNSYSTMADYNNEYTFTDDKILFTQNMKTFEEFKLHYKYMLSAFESGNMKDLELYAFNNASIITKLSLKFSDFGQSRNYKFDKYLSNFEEVAFHLDNLTLWLTKKEVNSRYKRDEISHSIKNAKLHFDKIKKHAVYWKKDIDLSDEEYNEIDPEKITKKEYHYKQTIPLNPDGIDVFFNLDIHRNSDNTMNVRGTTNLFDKASLMISLKDANGLLLAQNKASVENGRWIGYT